ncbi:hypothetical protein Cob_v012825 [Colletotrichum orbiculare MAFF 240422]|uniref:Uncharacterized protein n=1 Tax=Colletotrichum orbiculare (strain 104-T / ATCC 96160 / CBS 514.97 / LARS 414 / MAFF 240422) TaxID=1213857 RepID=A0A484FB38_COLOR|nr:hypothetical protein Cob_v012825 [Colletotrichum orbiculare MAFF 240422]
MLSRLTPILATDDDDSRHHLLHFWILSRRFVIYTDKTSYIRHFSKIAIRSKRGSVKIAKTYEMAVRQNETRKVERSNHAMCLSAVSSFRGGLNRENYQKRSQNFVFLPQPRLKQQQVIIHAQAEQED